MKASIGRRASKFAYFAFAVFLIPVTACGQDGPKFERPLYMPPAACTGTCRTRAIGEVALQGDGGAGADMLAQYKNALGENRWKQLSSYALGYSAVAIEGAGSGLGDLHPAAGAALGLTVKGINDLSGHLMSEYDEAVRVRFVIEADKQLGGNLIGDDGRVDVAALNKNGSLSWLTSADFFSKIDPAHREALQFARENAQIELLKNSAGQMTITQGMIESNGKLLNETFGAVSATIKLTEHIEKTADANHKEVRAFHERSLAATQNLERIAVSNLPPRQKLALVKQGVISMNEDQRLTLERTVRAQDIVSDGKQVSSVLGQSAAALGALGVDPKVVQGVSALGSAVEIGTGLVAAYMTGNPIGMAMGAFQLAGLVGGFGKQNGPSPEVQLLQQVLERLNQIERKIDKYHEEEMAALEEINKNILALRGHLDLRLSEIEVQLLDLSQLLDQTYAGDLSHCETGTKSYKATFVEIDQLTVTAFNKWLNPTRARQWYGLCVDKLATVITPFGGEMSRLFTPQLQITSEISGLAAFRALRNSVTGMMRPTLDYAVKYDLWTPEIRTGLRAPIDSFDQLESLGKGPANDPNFPPPPLGALLVTQVGGTRVIDAPRTLSLSEQARTVLEWTPLIVEPPGKNMFAANMKMIERCKSKPTECQLKGTDDAVQLLQRQKHIVQFLLEQEQLIAGLPLIVFAARALEDEVLTPYQAARSSPNSSEALRKVVTRIATIRPVDGDAAAIDARSACSTGERGRDTLCLMQANPLFAENVITYLVWKRLKMGGGMTTYPHALTWPDPSLLEQRLGKDLRFFDAANALPPGSPSADITQWSVELPRVFTSSTDQLKAVDIPQPKSCWHEIDPAGDDAHQWWRDEIRVHSDVTADPRWARCYMLPAPAAVFAQTIVRRPRFEAISEELNRLDTSMKALAPVSPSSPAIQ